MSKKTDSRPTASTARIVIDRCRDNWPLFHEKILGGGVLWRGQKQIWESVAKRRRTLVLSGHATGKDYTIGRIVPWFLFTHVPSIVLTTAPTDRQVRHVVWGEIHDAAGRARMRLGGKLNDQDWTIRKKHYAVGFTTRDHATSSAHFQGFHSANVLLVVSEAAGMQPKAWESWEGVTTGEKVRMLAVCQAINEPGPFLDAVRNGCYGPIDCPCDRWHIIHLSSWDAAEANEKLGIKALASRQWCESRRDQWGEDSPIYQSRVLGQVPDASDDAVIPLAWIVRAMALELSTEGVAGIGVDVAWRGSDASVISVVRGQVHTRQDVIQGQDTVTIAGRTLQVVREEGIRNVAVDVGGVGAGVYDQLSRASERYRLNLIGVNFGEKPANPDDYVNKSAEMWWRLREDLRLGLFKPMDDDDLHAELTNRKYDHDQMNRIKIESKKDMKKRNVKSPDRGDALVLAREACSRATSCDLVPVGDIDDENDSVNWKELE